MQLCIYIVCAVVLYKYLCTNSNCLHVLYIVCEDRVCVSDSVSSVCLFMRLSVDVHVLCNIHFIMYDYNCFCQDCVRRGHHEVTIILHSVTV